VASKKSQLLDYNDMSKHFITKNCVLGVSDERNYGVLFNKKIPVFQKVVSLGSTVETLFQNKIFRRENKNGRIKGTKDTMEHICYPLMTL
jgi:hypothetical protein